MKKVLSFDEYVERAKDRIYTIAYNNIKDCQKDYRYIFLNAIIDNVIYEKMMYRDDFNQDYIDVFETDENYDPIPFEDLDNHKRNDEMEVIKKNIYDKKTELLFYPVYKEVFGIEYKDDVI